MKVHTKEYCSKSFEVFAAHCKYVFPLPSKASQVMKEWWFTLSRHETLHAALDGENQNAITHWFGHSIDMDGRIPYLDDERIIALFSRNEAALVRDFAQRRQQGRMLWGIWWHQGHIWVRAGKD